MTGLLAKLDSDAAKRAQAEATATHIIGVLDTLPIRPPHPPGSPDYIAVVKMIAVTLSDFEPIVLEATGRTLAATWDKPNRWPLPAELRQMCTEQRDSIRPQRTPDRPQLVPPEEPPEYSAEHRERILAGLARLKQGHDQLFGIYMTAEEWSDWCKHGVKPEDLEVRIAKKIIAPDVPSTKYARFLIGAAP